MREPEPTAPLSFEDPDAGKGGKMVSVVQIKRLYSRGVETKKGKILISFQSPLRHHKTYVYRGTENGQEFGKCRACQSTQVSLFSDAMDANGKKVRVCFQCLETYGSREQLDIAASGSKHVRRYLDCCEALRKLERLFPDLSHRPYGDKALELEIARPCRGFDGIERILTKVSTEAWTRTDELAIREGRAAVDAKYADRNTSLGS